jgi:hypothetical protein
MKRPTKNVVAYVAMLTFVCGVVLADKHPIGNPAKNHKKTAWELAYDEDHPTKDGDHAIRLIIPEFDNPNSGDAFISKADLYRFHGVSSNKYVKKDDDKGGKVLDMFGFVTRAPDVEISSKKFWKKAHLRMVLVGKYTNAAGAEQGVVVIGHFHTGHKNKKDNRAQYRVVLHILEPTNTTFAKVLAALNDAKKQPEKSKQYESELITRCIKLALEGTPCDEIAPADAAIEGPDFDENAPQDFPYTQGEE